MHCSPVNISSCSCFVRMDKARLYKRQLLQVFRTSLYSNFLPPVGSKIFRDFDEAIFFKYDPSLFDTKSQILND